MFKLGKAEERAYSAREHVLRKENQLIFKTTRAGATTNIIARSIDYEKRTLYVGPTLKSCYITVGEGVALSRRDDAIHKHIESNKHSICFQERVTVTPFLKDDGQVVNIDSNKCAYREKGDTETQYCEHYESCPVTEILRIDLSKVDIISITHAKFASLQIAHQHWIDTEHKRKNELPPISVQIYLKLIKWADIIFYDECHYLELPEITSQPIYTNNEPINYDNLRQYAFKNEDGQPLFPLIADIVEHFIEMIDYPRITKVRNDVIGRAGTKNHWQVHLCDPIRNPHKFIFTDDSGKPYEHQELGMKEFFDTMLLLIEHIGKKRTHRTSLDIATLYSIAKIVTSDIIALNASRTGENISVELLVNDPSKSKNTARLMRKFDKAGKKLIMTSATIGDHDYDEYLGDKYLNSFWGGNGDPLHTNASQLILCDSRTYDMLNSTYSLFMNIPIITDQIIRYLNAYGDDDVVIFTMSAYIAELIEDALAERGHRHDVDYYGSTTSVAVSCESRVVISVLMAEKPSNMCDSMFLDNHVSKMMRLGLVHAATLQGISRGKDPSGKIPSLVILLGVRESKARPMLTWGSNRKVTIDEGELKVTCDEYIPIPMIKGCSDYDEMFKEATKYKAPPTRDSKVPYIKKREECLNFESEASRIIQEHDEDTSQSLNNLCRCGKSRENDEPLTILPKTNQEQADLYKSDKDIVSVLESILPIDMSIGTFNLKTDTRYLLLNKIIGRHDIFDLKDDEGNFFRQNQELDRFIDDGCHTYQNTPLNHIAACMLSVDNKVECMFFDIKGSVLGNKKATSLYNKEVICNYLDSQNISHCIEERSKFSFRIWIFFTEKINARDVREFGKHILKELSIKDVKVFPEKCMVKRTSPGDFVELPQDFDIKPIVSTSNAPTVNLTA